MMITNDIQIAKNNFVNKLNKGQLADFDHFSGMFQEENDLEKQIFKNWFNAITEFGFIKDLPTNLEEVYIHSPTHIVVKTAVKKVKIESDITSEDLQIALEFMTLKNKISWNINNPFVSFSAIIGERPVRVSLSHHCISPDEKSSCFIRFQKAENLCVKDFGIDKTDTVIELVKAKKNILISGSTGSGKTSFLNSLLAHTNSDEHLIILEDTTEINPPHNNTTRLITDDGHVNKTLNSFMSYAMRMSPDRLVLGEIRSQEVEPYLLAMNTGHSGLISTVHANSAKDALERIALLFKVYSAQDLSYDLVLKLICSNIDYVFFLHEKKLTQIINVFGSEGKNIFFEEIDFN
jgi:type IV secretion system protein VirB11